MRICAIVLLGAVSGAFLLATPSVTSAATNRGIPFADKISIDGTEMTLRGIGILRKYFIKGYLVGLYLPVGVQNRDALKDVGKRLEYYFFLDMEAEDFRSTGLPLMARNIGDEAAARLQPELESFNRLYRDVPKGQRYTITYLPGRGTELALQGKSLGWVEGADFASAYFSIWLGPHPVSDELKEGLFDPTTTK
jgi:hypothetical protein